MRRPDGVLLFLILMGMMSFGQISPSNQTVSSSIEKLVKRAEKGDLSAQIKLAEAYSRGIGVIRNDVEAIFWLQKASDRGDPAAQNDLGYMYAEGRGIERDQAMALKWFL